MSPVSEQSKGGTLYTSSSTLQRENRELRKEQTQTWILTLSMRFRNSTREKFFVTYLKQLNHWLRVSVTIDHDSPEVDSLEFKLQNLKLQQDKNFAIYMAVCDSIDEICWFDTVTNLRLETRLGRLHIHVGEDVNEAIPYPPTTALSIDFGFHGYLQVDESEVFFESHLSGFVYKVCVHGKSCVKKEISSVDTVQEFLYEIEALAALRHSRSIINLIGIVVNSIDGTQYITGVLIEWACEGALNDYFYKKKDIGWQTRLKWIKQVIQGVADIHEAGFVQGDCTLSNVVLDADMNARIIDMNRRGCPIGWEPPEFRGLIRSGQRVALYIGVKSDLYQLGMLLWAIANMEEEPNADDLFLDGIQEELTPVLKLCLGPPAERRPARELLGLLAFDDLFVKRPADAMPQKDKDSLD